VAKKVEMPVELQVCPRPANVPALHASSSDACAAVTQHRNRHDTSMTKDLTWEKARSIEQAMIWRSAIGRMSSWGTLKRLRCIR